MASEAAEAKTVVSEEKRARARSILFWLGILYVVLLTYSMTPFTHQLDDIKEVVIYVGGPILLVTYLVFLALGLVDPPRRGTLITVGAYHIALLISTILAEDFLEWKAWQGFWKQWVMLGPFVVFLGCCSEQKLLRRTIIVFTVVAFGTTVFGLLHYGVPRPTPEDPNARRGVLHGIAEHYQRYFQGNLPQMRAEHRQLKQAVLTEKDPARQQTLMQELQKVEVFVRMAETERQRREENSPVASFLYGLAVTFSQGHAEKTMMSVILSRSFYGGYLLLMIPFAIASFFMVRSWSWRWVPIVTILFSWLCIKYTHSKIGIPGAMVQIVFVSAGILVGARFDLKNRKKWIALTVAVLIVVACVGAVLAFGEDMIRLTEPNGVEKALRRFAVPLRSRLIIWQGAVEIWKDHPIFGAGPLNFDILFPFYRRPDYNLNEISHRTIFAHNMFLDLLGETGIVGFATFMSILGFFAWRLLVRMRRDTEDRHTIFAVCLLGSMLGYYTNNCFSPNSRWPIGAGNMWAFLGVVAGFLNRGIGASIEARQVPGWLPTLVQRRIAWVLVGLAAICGIWTSYYGVQYYRSAMENNKGLMLLGSDGGSGPVQNLFNEIRERRQQLRNPKLPASERAELQRTLPFYEQQFREYREKALAHFQRAVEMNPHFTSAYYKIANLYYMGPDANPTKEDFRRALEMYEKLRTYQPEYAQIRQNLGSVYWSLGEYKTALKHMRRSSEQSIQPDPNVRYMSSLTIAARRGLGKEFGAGDLWRPEEFFKALRERKSPVAKRVWEGLSDSTRKAIENETGHAPSDALLETVAKDLDTFLKRPDAFPDDLVEKMKLPESTRQWISAHPAQTFERNWIVLGDAFDGLVAMEYEEEAVRRARRIFDWWQDTVDNEREIAIDPRFQKQVRENVVGAYIETARVTERELDLMRGLKVMRRLKPDDERAVREMVNAYIRMDRKDELEKVLLDVLERSPTKTAERSYLVQLYLQTGRLRDALAQTIVLSRINPDVSDISYLHFLIAKAMNKPDEARKWAEEYLNKGRNMSWRREAQNYLRNNR